MAWRPQTLLEAYLFLSVTADHRLSFPISELETIVLPVHGLGRIPQSLKLKKQKKIFQIVQKAQQRKAPQKLGVFTHH